jgi:hypothetical protein
LLREKIYHFQKNFVHPVDETGCAEKPSNMEKTLTKAGKTISQEILDNLIYSMPGRVKVVIQAKGCSLLIIEIQFFNDPLAHYCVLQILLDT